MENTTIVPTYKIEVQFKWKYPGQQIKNVVKSGFIETSKTEDKLIAEEYINSTKFIRTKQI